MTFPDAYRKELQNMQLFIKSLDLPHYETHIKQETFGIQCIIQVSKILTQKLKNKEIEQFWASFFTFEAYLSLSKSIIKYDWQFPEFSENEFFLQNFYHPVLTNPVKNNFQTTQNVVLLTGANMSGKSTFLKALSLCVYLANLGMAVPASTAKLPFMENIHLSINLQDDILKGYSHFMSEILHLKTVLQMAISQKKCFVVFDEIFRGTNHQDAIEISRLTLKGLKKFKNSLFFISTHLQELKNLQEIQDQEIDSYYFDCEIQDHQPRFTYQIKKGWSDLQIGQILFEKEGLNDLLNVLP